MNNLNLIPSTVTALRVQQLPTPKLGESETLQPIPMPAIAEKTEYHANSATDWVVEVDLLRPFDVKKISEKFDMSWRKIYGGLTIYGVDAETNKWTFLISSEAPESVTRLQLAWDYDAEDSVERYEARTKGIKQALNSLDKGQDINILVAVAPQQARERALRIAQLKAKYDKEIFIRLIAPMGKLYDGKLVWNAMYSLGLEWGDMDVFHWNNVSNYGGDFFFSVWTSTAPGYFFPEAIKENSVHVEDLIFGFSVPRSANPEAVFINMLNAVKYTQRQLGGVIVNEHNHPIDEKNILHNIREIVKDLSAEGFVPGSNNALTLF